MPFPPAPRSRVKVVAGLRLGVLGGAFNPPHWPPGAGAGRRWCSSSSTRCSSCRWGRRRIARSRRTRARRCASSCARRPSRATSGWACRAWSSTATGRPTRSTPTARAARATHRQQPIVDPRRRPGRPAQLARPTVLRAIRSSHRAEAPGGGRKSTWRRHSGAQPAAGVLRDAADRRVVHRRAQAGRPRAADPLSRAGPGLRNSRARAPTRRRAVPRRRWRRRASSSSLRSGSRRSRTTARRATSGCSTSRRWSGTPTAS